MGIEEIINYIRVSDRIASSGQPDEHQFRDIADAGYQVVLNLAMPNSDNAIPEEGNIVSAHEMVYVHIPVPFDSPNIDHLRMFIRVMNAFSDQRIWIHCVVNHRVSAFLYQYLRLVQGVTQAEAREVMLPTWKPDKVWQDFMTHEIEYV
jgi:protein tyrosine phosphatase (PTP) superfamily phosphohydrolase (DUF442 family)